MLVRTIALLFVVASIIGCSDSETTNEVAGKAMTFKETVQSSRNSPVEESVDAVAASLANSSVLVATEGSETRWKTAVDNNGDVWAYFYTDESELLKAIPEGATYVEMRFPDAFSVIESNSQFRGIYLNSASEEFYPIPQELFTQVSRVIKESSID